MCITRMMRTCFLLLFLLTISVSSQQEKINFNPYEVLNVDRSAAVSDIRSSYKKLAKEWHPDKNKSPNAQEKFIEIQQAYEILSDENKREQYDTGGYSSDSVGQWQFHGEPFTFHYSDFTFDFTDSEGSTQALSLHDYYSRVIPESHHTPHLIYVYSTFCGRCILWLRTHWQQAANDLESLARHLLSSNCLLAIIENEKKSFMFMEWLLLLSRLALRIEVSISPIVLDSKGIAVYTVDTTFTSRIATSLGVTKVPTIVGLYKERTYFFKGQITKAELKTFVNSFLPDNIKKITSSTTDEFLASIDVDDKPRVMLFSDKPSPTLLYTLLSVKFQRYFSFGYVNLKNEDSESIVKNFAVNRYGPTLLLFKDSSRKPSVVLGATQMPKGAINEILSANKYVVVPRLTSQFVFDDICSVPRGAVHDVRLCMILVSDPSFVKHDVISSNFKQLVEQASSKEENLNDWLTFMRVYTSTQPAFTRSLISEEISEPKLLLLWRHENTISSAKQLDVEFLTQSFSHAKEGFQVCLRIAMESAHLQSFANRILLLPLVDELAPGPVLQILRSIIDGAEYVTSVITDLGEKRGMALVIVTLLLISWINGILNRSMESEISGSQRANTEAKPTSDTTGENGQARNSPEDGKRKQHPEAANSTDPAEIKEITIPQSMIDELSPVTYDSLVLSRSRGQLTIILLCNKELAATVSLIEDYRQALTVFARDPRLSVTYLDISKFSSWYSEVRRTASAEPPGDNKEVESVSSLHSNGDFDRVDDQDNVSHARTGELGEAVNGTVLALNGLKHWFCMYVPRGVKWGVPVSAQSSSSEESYAEALQCWMDRVREGQMPRLYVRQWPGLYAREKCVQDEDDF